MDKRTTYLLVIFLISLFLFTAEDGKSNVREILISPNDCASVIPAPDSRGNRESMYNRMAADSNRVILEFSFQINRAVYQKTNFGEPPQLAIWIESPDSRVIKTVWVTHRAAKNDWKGKVECPVALPYWESRTTTETAKPGMRSQRKTKYNAVSGATPAAGRFSARITVPQKTTWNYFVEVNASADYNRAFPYWSKEGMPDSQANGQPSLVYRGRITADGSSQDIPVLIGRTEQRYVVNTLSDDLSGITTAKELIENITVISKP